MASDEHVHSLAVSMTGARRVLRQDPRKTSLGALAVAGAILLLADLEPPPTALVFDPPQVTLAAPAVNFQSPPQNVTLRNTGGAPINLRTLVLSNLSAFAVSLTNCPADQILPPGRDCAAVVTFLAPASNESTGTLSLGAAGPGAALRGTVVPAVAGPPPTLPNPTPRPDSVRPGPATPTKPVDPPSGRLAGVAFGVLEAGAVGERDAVLANTGRVRLGPIQVRVTGAGSSVFTPRQWTCASIAPGTSCTQKLTFQPTAAGAYEAKLEASLPSGVALRADVTGSVRAKPLVTRAAFNPRTVTFGTVDVQGGGARQSVTLVNTGDTPLTGVRLRLSGAQAFTSSTASCATLPPGQPCEVQVVFQPTEIGAANATLTAAIGPTELDSASLAGAGSARPRARIDVTPGQLRFQAKGSQASFSVRNAGNAPLTLRSIAQSNPQSFELRDNRCKDVKVLQPQQVCDVTVRSRQDQNATGTVSITSDDAANAVTVIELTASAAMKLVKVPGLQGDRREEVEPKLRARSLSLGTTSEKASCRDFGKVVAQNPDRNVEVAPSTPVNITVSSPGPSPSQVPALRQGESRSSAVDRINKAGLSIAAKTRTRRMPGVEPGTVVGFEPDPGTRLAPQCEITLTLAEAPPPTLVPNYVGMTLADAKNWKTALAGAFSGASFTIGNVTTVDGSSVTGDERQWRVVSQVPPARSRTTDSSVQINLVVSPGPGAAPTGTTDTGPKGRVQAPVNIP